MNILFLAPRYPFPADTGGKIRTLNILKQLLKLAKVHLVCFSFDVQDHDWRSNIEKLGARVTLVPACEGPWWQKGLSIIGSSLPYAIIKYHAVSMKNTLNALCSRESFHVVHIDHLHMSQYKACFGALPCFLDQHNVEHKILERCFEAEPWGIKKFAYKFQAQKMKNFETKKIREFKGVLTCSLDDQKALQDLQPDLSSYIVPNGVDTEFFKANGWLEHEDVLTYTGSMDWLPNDDAMVYFCQRILPYIWQKKPAVKLHIIGKGPSTRLKNLAVRDKRIVVTGCVDDVRLYISRARVFIAPLRIGGGTRLKILEAMSMGKAVVATVVGAEGIAYSVGENILLGTSPQDFADKVLYLLNKPQKAREIGECARQLVCQRYDWDIIGDELRRIYQANG